MPKTSDNARLQQAIEGAILDRESLADAYGYEGSEANEAVADVKRLGSLRRKRLSSMSADALSLAFKALVWAEQWESGLADANPPGSEDRRTAALAAASYRELRLRRWGKTQFEAIMERAVSVPIDEIPALRRSRK